MRRWEGDLDLHVEEGSLTTGAGEDVEKEETYLVLEGVKTRATTVQISLKFPQKTKNRNIAWRSHTALEHTVLENYTTLCKLLPLSLNTYKTVTWPSFTSYSLSHHGTEMRAHPFLQLPCSQETENESSLEIHPQKTRECDPRTQWSFLQPQSKPK